MNLQARPFLLGTLMGAMMLFMLHGPLMSGEEVSFSLILVTLAHIAIAVVALGIAAIGAKVNPRLRSLFSNLHRPSKRHFANMLIGAATTFVIVHITVHSGTVSWT